MNYKRIISGLTAAAILLLNIGEEASTVNVFSAESTGASDSSLQFMAQPPKQFRGLNIFDQAELSSANYISGQLVLGLSGIGSDTYTVTSSMTLDTDLNFINGSFIDKGHGTQFNVKDKGTQTVILGDYNYSNTPEVLLDYCDNANPAEINSISDIPFIYVDGTMSGNKFSSDATTTYSYIDGEYVYTDVGTNAPLNIFSGSFVGHSLTICGDLYLMDSAYNIFDNLQGTSYIHSWDESVYVDNAGLESHGGNIFCNGDLDLGYITVDGDIRVTGNCVLGNDVRINGRLIVGGNITCSSSYQPEIEGGIYCDGIIKGYNSSSRILKDNVIIVSNLQQEEEIYSGYTVTYYLKCDINGNALDERTGSEYTYYDASGNEITEAEAYNTVGVLTLAESGVVDIYPQDMTREAIYGYYSDDVEFIAAPSSTKLVTNINEVREAAGYSADTGICDYGIYITEFPVGKNELLISNGEETYTLNDQTEINSTSAQQIVSDGILLLDNDSYKYTHKNVTITPDAPMWIWLKQTNTSQSTFIIDDSEYPVYILVDGDVNLENTQVLSKSVYEKIQNDEPISENDASNIIWYSTADSILRLMNNTTCSGNILAPMLDINITPGGGVDCRYQNSKGDIVQNRAPLIGNVTAKSISVDNNFVLFSTKYESSELLPDVIASGECGENLTWTLYSDGMLYISGEGEMTDWSLRSDVPWYDYRKDIKSVIIENGVTNIGVLAFYDCSNLISIMIPNSVTSIGADAFELCSSLESITIPDSVTSIDNGAFAFCSRLESITIPDSVTRIGVSTFNECSRLKSVTIPDSVTSIGDSSFGNCYSLTTIIIPDSVIGIGVAFYNCENLESITILNTNCEIYDSNRTICNNIPNDYTGVIRGYTGSTAEEYALKYDRTFVPLDEVTTTTTTTTSTTATTSTTTTSTSTTTSVSTTTKETTTSTTTTTRSYRAIIWKVDTVMAQPGDTVAVAIKVDDPNSAGLCVSGAQFTLNAGSAIKFIGASGSEAYGTELSYNSVTMQCAFSNINSVAAEDGSSVAVLTFVIPDECKSGTYPISISEISAIDENGIDISKYILTISGSITVEAPVTTTSTTTSTMTTTTSTTSTTSKTTTTTTTTSTTTSTTTTSTTTTMVTVSRIHVSKSEIDLAEGHGETVNYNILPSNAENKNVIWSSSDESIAAVNEVGYILGISEGMCIIRVISADNPDAFAEISVNVIANTTSSTTSETTTSTTSATTTTTTITATANVITLYVGQTIEISGVESASNSTFSVDGDNVTGMREEESAIKINGQLVSIVVLKPELKLYVNGEEIKNGDVIGYRKDMVLHFELSNYYYGYDEKHTWNIAEGRNTDEGIKYSTAKWNNIKPDFSGSQLIIDEAEHTLNLDVSLTSPASSALRGVLYWHISNNNNVYFDDLEFTLINYGDVNNDGFVNAVDASAILAEYARLSSNKDSEFDELQKIAADINGDGMVSAVDASSVLSYYAYLSTGGKDDILTYLGKK